MDLESHLSHLPLYFRAAASGADLFCRAGLIFVLVVVKINLGHDLHRRQSSVLKHRAGELSSLDHLLHKNIRAKRKALLHRRPDPVLTCHNIDADRRAAGRCLDNTGCLNLGCNHLCRLLCVFLVYDRTGMEGLVVRRSDSLILHHLLGDHLIHGHGRPQISRSRIWDPQHIESRLYASVLSVHSVQGHKDHVRLPADLQHALAKQRRALPLSGFPYRRQVRSRSVKRQRLQFRKLLKQFLRLLRDIFKPHEQINQDSLMSSCPERPANLCPRKERNISLCAESAAQNYNLHNDLLLFQSPRRGLSCELLPGVRACCAACGPVAGFCQLFVLLPGVRACCRFSRERRCASPIIPYPLPHLLLS